MRSKAIYIKVSAALVFSIVLAVVIKWGQTGKPLVEETVLVGIVAFVNIMILGYIGEQILGKFNNASIHETLKKVLPSFAGFLVIALACSLMVVSVAVYVFFRIRRVETSGFIELLFARYFNSAIKPFLISVLLASGFFFYRIWRKAIERELKLKEENLRYKYQNLKSQVNPHFLFNSLNTLSELVYVDAKQADKYIQRLSLVYRYIIECEDRDLIELEKEIEFVSHYFALQKERERDKINLIIDICSREHIKVPPVSIQLLVENALKHNSRSVEKPLVVKVVSEGEWIVVSNRIQKKNSKEESTQTGLLNLKARIKIITGKELMVEKTDHDFKVKLPVVKV